MITVVSWKTQRGQLKRSRPRLREFVISADMALVQIVRKWLARLETARAHHDSAKMPATEKAAFFAWYNAAKPILKAFSVEHGRHGSVATIAFEDGRLEQSNYHSAIVFHGLAMSVAFVPTKGWLPKFCWKNEIPSQHFFNNRQFTYHPSRDLAAEEAANTMFEIVRYSK